MRNLIVCCDGTWNTPEQKAGNVPVPTNVVRLYNALCDHDPAGHPQLGYYHPGVGTEGGWWEKLAGGSVGKGLGKNIQSAYKWLAVNYRPGDRIFLFGFSRGAYTVRCLGSLILTCGLLDLTQVAEANAWQRVATAYAAGYRKRQERAGWAEDWAFHRDGEGAAVAIHFLGVWDTVGALGIPDELAWMNLFDRPGKYAFHNADLHERVLNARHAVALDEMRASFVPTLWANVADRATVKQLWFPGVHCDVGGGYPEKGLADGALAWMMDEAQALGLALDAGMRRQVAPDAQGVLHDSLTGVFKALRTQPRSIPPIRAGEGSLHASVLARQGTPPISQAPFRPTVVLKVGEERTLPIYARQHWNETGLYLESGATYAFTASGQWLDGGIECGPGGAADGTFQIGKLAQMLGSLWGQGEKVYQWLFDNRRADWYGTRRAENHPWFALLGAVANGGNPGIDGTPDPHATFCIGTGCSSTVAAAGYLYCFANDAWHFYGNNRGSVMLSVQRLA